MLANNLSPAIGIEPTPIEALGIPALRKLLDLDTAPDEKAKHHEIVLPSTDSLTVLADEIEAAGHGLVMVMGKGGRRQNDERSCPRG